MLGLKFAGLVLDPDKTGLLGNESLRIEAADIANLGDNTGGVDLTDAGNGSKGVGNALKLLFQCACCRPASSVGHVLFAAHINAYK